MKIAFMFPGQGAQSVGMGKDFFDQYPEAEKVFSTANEILGYDLAKLCFDGPTEQLNQTKYSQPAILVTSIACLRVLEKEIPELQPAAVAGLSLGEYTALIASGAISFSDAVGLVQKRAGFMQAASEQVKGGMASILGLEEEVVRETLNKCGTSVDVANLNCPGQVVVSGELEKINEITPIINQAGARRIVMLEVSGAFHSRLMEPARKQLEPYLRDVLISEPKTTFVANVTGTPLVNPVEIKDSLVAQVASATYWAKGIQNILASGIDTFIEIGPGKVLGGLLRRINKQLKYYNVEDITSLNKMKEGLGYALRK